MQKIDIRKYKYDLRAKMKQIRTNMDESVQSRLNRAIRIKLFTSREYKECSTVIIYISTPIEVDTKGIIIRAWKDGKSVIVPKCIDGTHEMDFYRIRSYNDVEPGTFGVLEPVEDKAKKVTTFKNSICIVPALSYDKFGYRLGYGGGYYDRFLSKYNGKKIGIVYNDCISQKLVHGRYDVPVDMVITENEVVYITK